MKPRREVLAELVAEGGDPGAIVEQEGLGALERRGPGLAEIVAARSRRTRTPPKGPRREHEGDRPTRRLRDARDKGRADGGEVKRLIREPRLGSDRAASRRAACRRESAADCELCPQRPVGPGAVERIILAMTSPPPASKVLLLLRSRRRATEVSAARCPGASGSPVSGSTAGGRTAEGHPALRCGHGALRGTRWRPTARTCAARAATPRGRLAL